MCSSSIIYRPNRRHIRVWYDVTLSMTFNDFVKISFSHGVFSRTFDTIVTRPRVIHLSNSIKFDGVKAIDPTLKVRVETGAAASGALLK